MDGSSGGSNDDIYLDVLRRQRQAAGRRGRTVLVPYLAHSAIASRYHLRLIVSVKLPVTPESKVVASKV